MERPLEVDVLGWMSISLYLTGNEEWVASSIGDSLSLSPVPGTRFLLSLSSGTHVCWLMFLVCSFQPHLRFSYHLCSWLLRTAWSSAQQGFPFSLKGTGQ
jgi:hypothetical protein